MKHVLWIGGSPDSGKSTIARLLADKHGFQLYDYDSHEKKHHRKLAERSTQAKEITSSSAEQSWINIQPSELFERAKASFYARFPLVLDDMQSFRSEILTVAEGFGLIPELVRSQISDLRQAVWLVSTKEFKTDSLVKRRKFSGVFNEQGKEAEAEANVLKRDLLIGQMIIDQAARLGLKVIRIDGYSSPDRILAMVEEHFAPYILSIRDAIL